MSSYRYLDELAIVFFCTVPNDPDMTVPNGPGMSDELLFLKSDMLGISRTPSAAIGNLPPVRALEMRLKPHYTFAVAEGC